jgi:hypothetical protein
MFYVGIDPGRTGSMSVLWEDGEFFWLFKFAAPKDKLINLQEALWFLQNHPIMGIWIEEVGYIPGDGGKGAFTFGDIFGQAKMMCEATGHPYNLVRPQAWQKDLALVGPYPEGKRKHAHQAKARALFPGQKFTLETADSALIAWYGYQKKNGG